MKSRATMTESPAGKRSFSTLVRRTHLFLALFLTPWVLMYAVSTFTMHHRALFTGEHRRVDPGFELIREETYRLDVAPNDDTRDVARRVLRDLDLEGAFSVRGNLEEGTLTIRRNRPAGAYRITVAADAGTVRVERQRFEMTYVLEMLHRQRGYQTSYWANDLWAVIVDGVIAAILLWAVTGLWMWWEMARTRRLGALCLTIGAALFLLFMLTL